MTTGWKTGAAIHDHRERRGLSVDALALRVGTSPQFVRSVERGLRNWPHHLVPALATALAVSQAELAFAAGLITDLDAPSGDDPRKELRALVGKLGPEDVGALLPVVRHLASENG